MSLHKLSAGGGVDYLLKNTCCGDVERAAATPLSSYYLESGYPPGRWLGHGLASVGDGAGISGMVSEEAMSRLFGLGQDPVTGRPLGSIWRVHQTEVQRVAARVAALPKSLGRTAKAAAISAIEAEEAGRRTPIAVSGFDLTFTMPKSASIVWALADPATQARIAAAHAAAVTDCLAVLEQHALFTRIGKNGIAQVETRGALAAGFDHWDTRTGDPNLHTHLVIANKIQGLDDVWRTIDATAVYAATVAISELYDVLVADNISAATGATWTVRDRDGRSATFEIDGISPALLADFSQRSVQVDAEVLRLLADFKERTGASPTRPQMLRIRQQATRASRPIKQLRPLTELLTWWRTRAQRLIPTSVEDWVSGILPARRRAAAAPGIDAAQLRELAATAVAEVSARRSTWTRWNLLAEAARATKTLRLSNTADRLQLLGQVADAGIDQFCLLLTPPELSLRPSVLVRGDGVSAFHRHRAEIFTSPAILAAEQHLLDAITDHTGPRVIPELLAAGAQHLELMPALAADQIAAVHAIATSGRRLEVLVGPAGSGKTTTLRALRTAWESDHGPGSVVGLAPSATAAAELAAALDILCENTAKWLHNSNNPGARRFSSESQVTAGQLLIVDEASLAGTLALDELLTQTRAAGAKLLLVGDHRQLSAIDAGGAFGLLATETGAIELQSLWRFRNRWEAEATRLLRAGDPTVIDSYHEHGRLHAGPAEVMQHDAYTAWASAIAAGQTALLIAADTATVTALNTHARNDRINAGLVQVNGVALHDGTTAGVGDTVITRRNDRATYTSTGSWIRNGDLWTVTAHDPDGALTLTRPAGEQTTNGRRPAVVTVSRDYVAAHVELGYASTAFRAQGSTVDASFALLRTGMSRELAYVAITRGRTANHAYIATDTPDPTYDGAPAPETTGRHILQQILATTSAEASATATVRQLQHDAESLAVLGAQHETLIQQATKAHWHTLITNAMPAPIAADVISSPSYGPLIAAIRRAENDGLNPETALRGLAALAPLTPEEGVQDPAAVLHHRIHSWHASRTRIRHSTAAPTPTILELLHPPSGPHQSADPLLRAAIRDLERRITDRVEALHEQATTDQPSWIRRLGPRPSDAAARETWTSAVTAILAYRDTYAITDPDRPLGATPTADANRLAIHRRTLTALHVATQPPARSTTTTTRTAHHQRTLTP